jgi:predicted DNA-binding protein (MmcQ/YjbR family)
MNLLDNIEKFRQFCLSKKGVVEDMPFGDDVLVFKVAGKIFALTNLNSEEFKVNLKCDPMRSEELRDKYPAINPGYHMNKNHWNTLTLNGSIPDTLFRELINHSYELIFQSLPKKIRESL